MKHFNQRVLDVFEAYHQRMEEENQLMSSLPHEEGMKRRDEFLLPVGEEVGAFLYHMVVGASSSTIVEVGTSYGYSTLWLASAAQETGGRVITMELDAHKSAYAAEQIEKAGLSDVVDFRVGDAIELIETATERFDFALIDIWKELYVSVLQGIFPKLNPNAYLVGDNMLHPASHLPEAAAYKSAIRTYGQFDSVLLPIGSGIEISQLTKNI